MDYKKTLIIGDLQYHPEILIMPIGLYYHELNESPMVIYLPDDPIDLSWCQLAVDFDTFAKELLL